MKTLTLTAALIALFATACELEDTGLEQGSAGAQPALVGAAGAPAAEPTDPTEPEPVEECELRLVLTKQLGDCGEILEPISLPRLPSPDCCRYEESWRCETPDLTYLPWALGTQVEWWTYTLDENGDGFVTFTGLKADEATIVCQARYTAEGLCQ